MALLVGAVLTACGIRIVKYEFSDDHTVAQAFTSVRVRTGSGDVSIRHVQGLSETKIHRRVGHEKNNRPTGIAHRVEGNTLVLDDCGDDCDINYDVQVPSADITVQGDVGSGDATIEGLASVDYKASSGKFRAWNIAGNVQITAGSGDIEVRDVTGDVKAIASSGRFTASRVKGGVTADLGSGDIRLDQLQGKTLVTTGSGDINGSALDNDLTAEARSGDVDLNFVSARTVRVDSTSGNLTVRVPASSGPYRVTAESGSGDRRVDVQNDPAAKYELKLTASSGDVKVLAV